MAEMLVALWLSCCKPHSPGRVNPTFKPKPRYRQPGQQQWHISNYPKTKCPSFVCNPHSGNSASQHMELSLGGLGGFWMRSIMQQFDSPEMSGGIKKTGWLMLGFLASLWCCCDFSSTFATFFLCIFIVLFNGQLALTVGNNWTSTAPLLTSPCESLSGQWDLF